jgi:hypothetical protein
MPCSAAAQYLVGVPRAVEQRQHQGRPAKPGERDRPPGIDPDLDRVLIPSQPAQTGFQCWSHGLSVTPTTNIPAVRRSAAWNPGKIRALSGNIGVIHNRSRYGDRTWPEQIEVPLNIEIGRIITIPNLNYVTCG